jgi:hypothetical protein
MANKSCEATASSRASTQTFEIQMKFQFPVSCPKCRSTSGLRSLEVEDNGTGFGIFLLGGLIPWALHNSSQKDKLVCGHCGFAFDRPSNLSSKKLLFLTLLFLLLAGFLTLGFIFLN